MNGMANMRIGKRLMLAFGTLTALMLAMTIVSLWAQSALNDMNESSVQKENQAYLAARAQRDVDLLGRHLGVALLSRDKTVKEDRLEQVQTSREHYRKRLEDLVASKPSSQVLTLTNTIDSEVADMRELNVKVAKLIVAGQDAEAANLYLASSVAKMDKVAKTFDELKKVTTDEVKESQDKAQGSGRNHPARPHCRGAVGYLCGDLLWCVHHAIDLRSNQYDGEDTLRSRQGQPDRRNIRRPCGTKGRGRRSGTQHPGPGKKPAYHDWRGRQRGGHPGRCVRRR
jgi:hypothetical protein